MATDVSFTGPGKRDEHAKSLFQEWPEGLQQEAITRLGTEISFQEARGFSQQTTPLQQPGRYTEEVGMNFDVAADLINENPDVRAKAFSDVQPSGARQSRPPRTLQQPPRARQGTHSRPGPGRRRRRWRLRRRQRRRRRRRVGPADARCSGRSRTPHREVSLTWSSSPHPA
jgi:hypothetical protein